jgi:hypothetical protein
LMIIIFSHFKASSGVIWAGAITAVLAYTIGIISTITIPETHDKDLDYLEE